MEPPAEQVSSNYKNTKAYQILVALRDGSDISPEHFEQFSKKLEDLQQLSDGNMLVEVKLKEALKRIEDKYEVINAEVATANKKQEELSIKIQQKMEEREKWKSELSEYETQRQLKTNYELERLKDQIKVLEDQIKKEEESQMQKLQAELNELEGQNLEKKKEIESLKERLTKGDDEISKLKEFREKIEMEIKKKNKLIEQAKTNLSNKKGDRDSEAKEYKNNEGTFKKCEDNNNAVKNDIKNLEDQNTKKKSDVERLETTCGDLQKENEQKNQEKIKAEAQSKTLENKKNQYKILIENTLKLRDETEKEKKKKCKDVETEKDNLKKQQHTLRANERRLTTLQNKILEQNNSLQEEMTKSAKENIMLMKCKEELIRIEKDIKKMQERIEDKQDNYKSKNEFKNQCEESKKNLEQDYKELEQVEKNIIQRADKTKERIEEIKAKKESIMRTKERLDEKTALINEEIKIKELIFLDMTKKYEELKHMYNKYNVLYKTVQAERNSNVVKIQNSNQNRAQLKEKMKILQTEMDILDSNLGETYNEIIEKDKDLNKMQTRHNSLKQEINLFGLKNLKYKEEITKLTNENEKLHSIINAIENEMVSFRVNYETTCESRNYTGIQLIDRNDELCIFYEKIHHIENKISDLYKVILEKEAVLKRSVVEVNEIQRFIEVNRKKIPEIPELSNKIKELQTELQILNKSLSKLIDDVENPENNLKVELPGDEPDINYLKNKYAQLTDMLNDKKEKLLEKELINDEINEIAEKLRKKALADRGNNLEISKKINEYEIKLNNNTRQTIAFTSELSMFQAILTRLENSKKEKEIFYAALKKRFDNGLLPPKEWLKKYFSVKKMQKRRVQYFKHRMDEVHEKENIVIGVIPHRRAPEKRPDEYIDPKTGLPSCVYGKYAPFEVKGVPDNMRHLKNMALRLKKPEENKEKERIVQI